MKTYKFEIKWAIVFALMTIVWMLIEKLAGLHDQHIENHAFYTKLLSIPALIVFILAMMDKRKNFYFNVFSFKKAFNMGIVLTSMIVVLIPIIYLIVLKVISPDYLTNASEYAISSGNMNEMEARNYFDFNSILLFGIITSLFSGLIISALAALITKHVPKPNDKLVN